jgi:hypothetical protein
VVYTAEVNFLIVLEARSSRSRCQQSKVWLRPLFLAYTQLPSCYILIWLLHFIWAPMSSLPLLISVQSYWMSALPLRPHLTRVTYLKIFSPNIVTLGVRASIYKFERDKIQSIIELLDTKPKPGSTKEKNCHQKWKYLFQEFWENASSKLGEKSTNNTPDKELISRIYSKFLKLKNQEDRHGVSLP